MLLRIINSGLLQRLYKTSIKNVRIPTRALSSPTQTHVTSRLLSPSRVCRSPPRYCSYLTNGENRVPVPNSPPLQTEETAVLENDQQNSHEVFNIDVLVALLRQENAQDICVIRVPSELMYTEYFVVVSGSSTRHLRAMAFYAVKVYKFMRGTEDPHVCIEGKDADDWLCLDFGDMVVHFMLPQTRETYELEKLWTLRHYDDQLSSIPPETLPTDFIYGADAPK
ncbi:mitochondrial assembly of ribosomal large subunit protein 1 [Clupea harengus]|uniref:Mitochondrial assembly of ribosomal large subunit protein 1 n=1 Tax=Clupea harengus TaxID=7950 RepID=A0A6P3WDL9_CLUHA|nr:mitochondrial assembly of ribosomal large subunit protein 1 [Clupea harengus]